MNNSPFTNIVNTLAKESITPNTNTSSSYWKAWMWVLLAIVGVIVGLSLWNWTRWANSPWLAERLTASSHFWDLLKPASSAIDPGKLPDGSSISSNDPLMRTASETDTASLMVQDPAIAVAAAPNHQETWCFVGEDKTGRWCVRVPTAHACDPDRTYESRDACELVTASAMPLGFLKHGGVSDTPLSARPAMSNMEVV